jgi:hypothetical protein
LLVGGFAISAFILSSISFVHTAQTRRRSSSRALQFAAFSLCRHFGFSFRIHSLRRPSVTTFQLVRAVSISGSALPPPLFLLPWVAEASIRVQPFAASHSALVHLGAGRGITFGGGVVVHSGISFQRFSVWRYV